MIRSLYLLKTPGGEEIAYFKAEHDRVVFGCGQEGSLFADGRAVAFSPPKVILSALPQQFALFVSLTGEYALWGDKGAAEKFRQALPSFKLLQERPVLREQPAVKQEPVLQKKETAPLENADAVRAFAMPEGEAQTYWDCNAADFLALLENNPEDGDMAELIPQSRWVHVERDGADTLFGVIFDEDKSPLYLCYGFDRPWRETPPDDLEGYCQWIPQDCRTPHGKGYWVIYVNAATGERIK